MLGQNTVTLTALRTYGRATQTQQHRVVSPTAATMWQQAPCLDMGFRRQPGTLTWCYRHRKHSRRVATISALHDAVACDEWALYDKRSTPASSISALWLSANEANRHRAASRLRAVVKHDRTPSVEARHALCATRFIRHKAQSCNCSCASGFICPCHHSEATAVSTDALTISQI